MPLLRKIQLFLAKSGISETRSGRLAVNDPRLVGDLRRGRSPGARVTARVERFIAEEARA